MDSLYNTLVSLLGGGLSGWIIASHQKRLDRRDEEERRKANDELEKMREQRRKATEAEISEIKASLQSLRTSLDQHAEKDNSDVILNELKNISGMQNEQRALITGMSSEVKQLLISDSRRGEKMDSLERYINGEAPETEISEIKASLNELSKSLKAHADADKADVILNELKNISGEQNTQSAMMTNISGEVKQLLVADGVRKEKIDSLERYIVGVDTSLREHKRNHPGGK